MTTGDQTFSAENFRMIWDQEKRRGRLMASFVPELANHVAYIKELTKQHRALASMHQSGSNEHAQLRETQREERNSAVLAKDLVLAAALESFSLQAATRIDARNYALSLVKVGLRNGKQAYRVAGDSAADFFLVKQIERNLSNAFDITLSDRHLMVTQLKILLSDTSPKSLLKADLQGFFESVPHPDLLAQLDSNRSLSRTSFQFVSQLLADYCSLSGSDRGLPRGVGISSFLAEIYLQPIDRAIKRLPRVTYYARYVDDIIVLSSRKSHDSPTDAVRTELRGLLRARGLSLNASKTKNFSSSEMSRRHLRLLGYEFKLSLSRGEVDLDMSKQRFDRYVHRLDAVFHRYETMQQAGQSAGAASALVARLELLTGNHRVPQRSGNKLVGISFSNRALDQVSPRLARLDTILRDKLKSTELSPDLRTRLSSVSFSEGFSTTRFQSFSQRRLKHMGMIWKYAPKDD